jgi:hypothetical protein
VGGVLDLLLKLYQPEVVINNFTGCRTRVDIRHLHARHQLRVNSTHPDIFQTKIRTSHFKKRLTHLTSLTLDLNFIRFQESILDLQPRSGLPDLKLKPCPLKTFFLITIHQHPQHLAPPSPPPMTDLPRNPMCHPIKLNLPTKNVHSSSYSAGYKKWHKKQPKQIIEFWRIIQKCGCCHEETGNDDCPAKNSEKFVNVSRVVVDGERGEVWDFFCVRIELV